MEGLDTGIPDGKSLARASSYLETVAAAVGVPYLFDFLSIDPEEAATMGGWVRPEDRDPDEPYPPEWMDQDPFGPDQFPPERWFDAGAGLASIRTLIQSVKANPAALARHKVQYGLAPKAEDVLADLLDFETILERLVSHDVRWHLGIDV